MSTLIKNYWMDCTPKPGMIVCGDEWNHGETLQPYDEWDKAEFWVQHADWYGSALNVEVTGRKVRQPFSVYNGDWVRVQMWVPGDCEPDGEKFGGWMRVDSQDFRPYYKKHWKTQHYK